MCVCVCVCVYACLTVCLCVSMSVYILSAIECVLIQENVFSDHRMCSLTIECVLLLGMVPQQKIAYSLLPTPYILNLLPKSETPKPTP